MGGLGEEGGGMQECLSHAEKRDDMWGFDRGGGIEGGTPVGGTLRNAWKVSVRFGRIWPDNPPQHIIIRLPTILNSLLLFFSLMFSNLTPLAHLTVGL